MKNEVIVTPKQLFDPESFERIEQIRSDWAGVGLDEVKAKMPRPVVFEVGSRSVKAVIIPPKNPTDRGSGMFMVRMAEYQQPYTAGQYMSTVLMRDLVMPSATAVMFQNNSILGTTHTVDDDLRTNVSKRGLVPIAEDKMRVLDSIVADYDSPKAVLTGWSLGGNMALAMAEVGSDKVEITHVNSDEPLSEEGRSVKGISKAFRSSGGLKDQLEAVLAARIPAFTRHFDPTMLTFVDYPMFALAYALRDNRMYLGASVGDISDQLKRIKGLNPDLIMKIGRVSGSEICATTDEILSVVDKAYYYDGFQRHATVNNPFAQALMMRQALK